MRLMAFMMVLIGLIASGSAKAAQSQVCGMVVELTANDDYVLVTVKNAQGRKILVARDNRASGTAALPRLATNTNIVNIASAAMNNPGSLDFCAKVDEKNQIVFAGISNRFQKK